VIERGGLRADFDGTRPVPSALTRESAAVAQLVERFLGKDEVMGSIPISSFSPERM
jgi:hypothetical protein